MLNTIKPFNSKRRFSNDNSISIVLLIAFLWNLFVSPLLWAQEKQKMPDFFEQGIAFYLDLEYDQALSAFEKSLGKTPLTRKHKAEILIGLGAIYVVLNEKDKAMQAFLSALEADPDITLYSPFQAPKIQEVFTEASKTFRQHIRASDQESPKIFFTPFESALLGEERLDVSAIVVDNIKVAEVRFYFRHAGDLTYSVIRMSDATDDRFFASVPSYMVTGTLIEYYLEAIDAAGNVTLDGNEKRPYQVEIIKPKQPWYQNWITWVAIMGTVGSGLALYLLIQNDPDVLSQQGKIEASIDEITTTPGVLYGR